MFLDEYLEAINPHEPCQLYCPSCVREVGERADTIRDELHYGE